MISILLPVFQKGVPKEYGAALEHLDDVVLEAILVRLVETLPEEKLGDFEAALQLSDSGVLEAFLENEVPNLTYLVQETLEELQQGASTMISALES
jgi:Protein of unknown function (DUF5663)